MPEKDTIFWSNISLNSILYYQGWPCPFASLPLTMLTIENSTWLRKSVLTNFLAKIQTNCPTHSRSPAQCRENTTKT